jgi:hypothetical protein
MATMQEAYTPSQEFDWDGLTQADKHLELLCATRDLHVTDRAAKEGITCPTPEDFKNAARAEGRSAAKLVLAFQSWYLTTPTPNPGALSSQESAPRAGFLLREVLYALYLSTLDAPTTTDDDDNSVGSVRSQDSLGSMGSMGSMDSMGSVGSIGSMGSMGPMDSSRARKDKDKTSSNSKGKSAKNKNKNKNNKHKNKSNKTKRTGNADDSDSPRESESDVGQDSIPKDALSLRAHCLEDCVFLNLLELNTLHTFVVNTINMDPYDSRIKLSAYASLLAKYRVWYSGSRPNQAPSKQQPTDPNRLIDGLITEEEDDEELDRLHLPVLRRRHAQRRAFLRARLAYFDSGIKYLEGLLAQYRIARKAGLTPGTCLPIVT